MAIENVVKTKKHILELGGVVTRPVLDIWLKLGVNCRPYENPPVVTKFPEILVLRGVYLRDLAVRTQARKFAEIGTARGFQSMLWAQYLVDGRIEDGAVYTCDVDGMDLRVYKTCVTGDRVFTRRELWEEYPGKSFIHFSHRPQQKIGEAIKDKLDLIYIDGQHTEDAVLHDFAELLPFITEKTIIVFDDYDERFPGVQRAVARIADENKTDLTCVTFEPHRYKIAIMSVARTDF